MWLHLQTTPTLQKCNNRPCYAIQLQPRQWRIYKSCMYAIYNYVYTVYAFLHVYTCSAGRDPHTMLYIHLKAVCAVCSAACTSVTGERGRHHKFPSHSTELHFPPQTNKSLGQYTGAHMLVDLDGMRQPPAAADKCLCDELWWCSIYQCPLSVYSIII